MTSKINVSKLKLARFSKGYSQVVLAEKAGVALLTLNLIEAAKTTSPHPQTIKKICNALEIPVTEIYLIDA